MLIDLKHEDGSHRQTVDVSLHQPPAVLRGAGMEPMALDWDRALDDEFHLRRCPVCGCPDLYAKKRIPQLTVFALVVLSAVLVMALFGFGQVILALACLAVVVIVDLLVFFLAGRELACYRCRTRYRKLPISPRQPGWDQTMADQYREERRRAVEAEAEADHESADPDLSRDAHDQPTGATP